VLVSGVSTPLCLILLAHIDPLKEQLDGG